MTYPEDHADPTDHHADIPMEPIQQAEIRWSSRVSQPSTSSLQSKEYLQREKIGWHKGEVWTTNQQSPQASLTVDWLSDESDNYPACLAETKAYHNIPQSYWHAMSTDSERWMIPMQIEMDPLKAKHTWDLVKPPPGANIMDSMWVYDIKWDG